MMVLKEVTDIIEKYDKEEEFLDKQLQEKCETAKEKEDVLLHSKQVEHMPVSAAVERNKELLKELELAKGKLRSKSIFSPTEINWDAICSRYQASPSLMPKSWKCDLYSNI